MAPDCRIAFRIGCAALAVVGLFGGAAAETLSPLAARLAEGLRAVEAARDRTAPLPDPDGLFPARDVVALGAETVTLDHASLRAEWRAVPAAGEARRDALDRLQERLRAVQSELAAADRTGGDPPPRWREQLAEVLSQPEFQTREAQPSVLDQVARWLLDWLASLLPQGTARAVGRLTDWVVHALAGAALLALALLLVRVAIPLFRRDRPAATAGVPGAAARGETPETLLALAEEQRAAGDFRGAVQAMFRWMLATLHQAGRLDYDPALTNREHLARLRADGTARATFAELAGEFEVAWYALRPVSPEAYAGFRSRCLAVAGGRR